MHRLVVLLRKTKEQYAFKTIGFNKLAGA